MGCIVLLSQQLRMERGQQRGMFSLRFTFKAFCIDVAK